MKNKVVHNNKEEARDEETSEVHDKKIICGCLEWKPVTSVMLVKLSYNFQALSAFCIYSVKTGTISHAVERMLITSNWKKNGEFYKFVLYSKIFSRPYSLK